MTKKPRNSDDSGFGDTLNDAVEDALDVFENDNDNSGSSSSEDDDSSED